MGTLTETVNVIVGIVASLGGVSLIKFLFFMRPERRKAQAEAGLKEVEKEERELGIMKNLVESLQKRIEQQDQKIKELNVLTGCITRSTNRNGRITPLSAKTTNCGSHLKKRNTTFVYAPMTNVSKDVCRNGLIAG